VFLCWSSWCSVWLIRTWKGRRRRRRRRRRNPTWNFNVVPPNVVPPDMEINGKLKICGIRFTQMTSSAIKTIGTIPINPIYPVTPTQA
jgi:hypothetical protein